jgi:antitoxin (DNA-binding transcriptional repressor) of toxin-antitoxin stability system
MKTANIRELTHATSTVLEWVEQGESVEITRRNKVVAIISPPPGRPVKKIVRPDYEARLTTIFGDKILPTTANEVMDYDRGDR